MAKVVGDTMSVLGMTLDPIPLWAYDYWVSRGVDWLVMSEDLPRDENRVTVDSSGRVRVHYRPNNLRPHEELVSTTRRILHRLGFLKVMAHSHRTQNTTHQCGTLVFGHDPKTSVLDTYCRTHDVTNLYVVDASFFPSSAAVNPGLTIVAQALRVAEHIRAGARVQAQGPRLQDNSDGS
jgi:choline dehydrogenase-like flavoprotein